MTEKEAQIWDTYNKARNAIFEYYIPSIRASIAKFVADHKTIGFDDALSAASHRVLVHAIPHFRGDKSHPETWIARHAVAAAKEAIRRNEAKSLAATAHDLSMVRDTRCTSEETDEFENRISMLQPESKTILRMIYLYGYTQTEVAKALGVCNATISVRLKKLHEFLKKKFTT